MMAMNNLDVNTIQMLQEMLHQHNPYVNVFRQALDVVQQQNPVNPYLMFRINVSAIKNVRMLMRCTNKYFVIYY